jgi:hypothetical protein
LSAVVVDHLRALTPNLGAPDGAVNGTEGWLSLVGQYESGLRPTHARDIPGAVTKAADSGRRGRWSKL